MAKLHFSRLDFLRLSHITLWLFNIAMENGPSIDGLSITIPSPIHQSPLIVRGNPLRCPARRDGTVDQHEPGGALVAESHESSGVQMGTLRIIGI